MKMGAPSTAPTFRPALRAELLADNKGFVELAGELLHAFRNTDDASCAICGAEQGAQHRREHVCFQLTRWRHATQYKKTK